MFTGRLPSSRQRFRVLATMMYCASILASSVSCKGATKMTAFVSTGQIMAEVRRRYKIYPPSATRLFSSPTQYNTIIGNATSDSTASSSDTSLGNDSAKKSSRDWEKAFVVEVPEGSCVGLRLHSLPSSDPSSFAPPNIEENSSHWIREFLHPKEVEFGIGIQSEVNRNSFFIGRLAMRCALMTASSCYDGGVSEMAVVQEICNLPETSDISKTSEEEYLPNVSMDDPCILKNEYGRPTVPPGFLGSISHKQNIGVALVAEDSNRGSSKDVSEEEPVRMGVGIDIEQASGRKSRIERKILTPNECENLGRIDGISRDEEVLLRFSLKESVYKAMHPHINQYVGFQEAEITPKSDGSAIVSLNLKSGLHETFGEITANWRTVLDGEYFLSSSSVTLKDDTTGR